MGGTADVFALVVEDDEAMARRLKDVVETGWRLAAQIAGSVSEARALLERGLRPRLFAIDIRLPDGDGMTLAEEVRRAFPLATIALVTGYQTPELNHRALRIDALYVLKPYGPAQIAVLVARALSVPALDERLRRAMDTAGADHALARRERQLLELKLQHYSHAQVMHRWDVHLCTVDSIARSLVAKTNAGSMPALANRIWRVALEEVDDETRRDESK